MLSLPLARRFTATEHVKQLFGKQLFLKIISLLKPRLEKTHKVKKIPSRTTPLKIFTIVVY